MYEKYISCEPDILGDYDTDTAMVQEENDEDDDEPDDAMDDGKKIIFICLGTGLILTAKLNGVTKSFFAAALDNFYLILNLMTLTFLSQII